MPTKKTPSRGKGKGKGKGKAPEMSDIEMCTAFVQHLGTKLASEGRNLEDRDQLLAAFTGAVDALPKSLGFKAELEANLPALFEQLWLQLKGPEPAADTGAPCFLGAPRLAATLDSTASSASDDPAALVGQYTAAFAAYPNVAGSSVVPGLLAEAHAAAGTWDTAVATSLVHDLAASLALPGAVGGRLLVLLDILIGHVAVGSDDAVATTSTLPLREWKKVLLLVHTVYTGASSADRAATFNGVGYTDHVAAALALYFRLLALDATEATAGKASKAAVGLLLQLTGSDPAVICDTLLQIDAGSFDGPAAAFCWRLMRGTVSGFERTIGWASQERAFDTFLRLALLARSAKQVGEEAGADAADLSTCAKFPAKVRCSFSTQRLRSRIEQLAPVNRDAMGLCQSTQALSVRMILAANAELAQLLFDGLAGASAAGDVAADDVTVAAASGATESDGPLFFIDAAGDGSSAGPDDSLPPSIGAIVDGKGSTDAVPMAEEEEEEESEAPAIRRSGRKRGPTKPSSKGSAKKRATKTKK